MVPFNVPVGHGTTFSGVIDVLQEHDENPPDCPLPPTEAYQMVVEQIVESDEELMMRYLEGDSIGVKSWAGPPTMRSPPGNSFLSCASALARTWASKSCST